MKSCPICERTYENHFTTCPDDDARLITSRHLAPGTLVDGKYRIDKLLGVGGMGVVYQAHHGLLGQPCALKFLADRWASDPKFVQRFLEEARAAVRLHHPNVVLTTDVSQTADGSFYICMEYVKGADLRTLLQENPHGMPVDRAVALIRGIAKGLSAAHAIGLVHRDVKPENVLVATGDGETPKIADFGIVARSDGQMRRHTTGLPVLTPEYASPEQWRGRIPSYELDGRTDLYALGVVFFELLTGRLPFHADSYEGWMEEHLHTTPARPSQLRRELVEYPQIDAAVMGLLAKEREQRTATVEDFLRDLETRPAPPPAEIRPQAEEKPVQPPPPPRPKGRKAEAKHRFPIVLYPKRTKFVLLLLGSLGFVWLGIWAANHPDPGSSDVLMGYLCAGFFGLCAVVGLILLFPGSTFLRLDDAGFTYCSLFREHSTRWEEVRAFAVVDLGMQRKKLSVGWDYLPEFKKSTRLGKVNRALVGAENALPDTYGKTAEELTLLMRECRVQALAE